MRVAFLFEGDEWSGSTRAFAAAARAFAEAGDPVCFIVPADGHAHERLAREGYDVVAAELNGRFLTRVLRVRRLLKRHGSEVIFVHTEREHLCAAVASRLGPRCAIVRRTPTGRGLALGWLTRFAARLAPSAFLFSSEREVRLALVPSVLGASVAANLGVRVPNPEPEGAGGSGQEGDGQEVTRDPNHILCIYDGVSRGRTALPIRTVAQLAPRHPEVRLSIAGPGSDTEEIRMHVAALDILPRVDLLGERDDLSQLTRGATFGWVACEGDDAAFAILDFMVSGLPVVAQYDEVSRQYVADGITGMLVAEEDASLAAGILAGAMGNTEQIERMGQAGRLRAARTFGESQMLEGFDQAARAARAGASGSRR